MDKQASIQQVREYSQDGMTVMIGGFLAVGTPEALIEAIIEKKQKSYGNSQ